MRRAFIGALVTAALVSITAARAASAQDGAPVAPDAPAIEAVIAAQLDAFNGRDVADAFSYASPMIQGMFGNPGNFGMMVQNGYPMVWSNGGAEFGDLRTEADGRLWQRVILRDDAGRAHALDYAMIQTPDGWRIDGVVILPPPDVGV